MSQSIPSKMWYVRRTWEGDDLAYMCSADGPAKALERRQETGRNWARGGATGTEFLNSPAEGFKIIKRVSRYSTSNQVWRVHDPRGFTVEIYSDNLMYIIQDGEIVNGIIKPLCCWARTRSGQNFLLIHGTSKYLEALAYTEKKSTPLKFIPLKTIKIGDTVRLKDGHQDLIYLGRLTPIVVRIGQTTRNDINKWNVIKYKRPPLCFFNPETSQISYFSGNKIVAHAPAITTLPDDFITGINQKVLDGIWATRTESDVVRYGIIYLVVETSELPDRYEEQYGYSLRLVLLNSDIIWGGPYSSILTFEKIGEK